MEFTPTSSSHGGETWCCDAIVLPRYSAGAQGRGSCYCLPMGLHVMFWCFISVLCGTLHLSTGATTVPTNTTSISILLSVPQEKLYSDRAFLEWKLIPPSSQVMNYYITYQLQGSNSKTVITVDAVFTSETLRNLEPDGLYRAFVKAVFNDTQVPYINSDIVEFETPEQKVTSLYEGKPGMLKGLLTLAMMFSLWLVVVFLFLRQWRIIRQLQPYTAPASCRAEGGGVCKPYEPRNIGHVHVVKKVKDSVLKGGSPKQAPSAAMANSSRPSPLWEVEEMDENGGDRTAASV